MLRISNVQVYDLAESIVASGYAMGLNLEDFNVRRDLFSSYVNDDDKFDLLNRFINFYETDIDCRGYDIETACSEFGITDETIIHDISIIMKDFQRMAKLVHTSKVSKNVKCHHNALTGIRVSFDIVYPNYISPEMQRYHWFDIVTSNSKMHKIMHMDFSKCCNKYVTTETIENMQKYIDEYNRLRCSIVHQSVKELKNREQKLYEAFMKVISNCPQGIELFMRVSTNYMQLQTMYFQRKNHKLKEDWGAFNKFVEELPFAKQLIIGE